MKDLTIVAKTIPPRPLPQIQIHCTGQCRSVGGLEAHRKHSLSQVSYTVTVVPDNLDTLNQHQVMETSQQKIQTSWTTKYDVEEGRSENIPLSELELQTSSGSLGSQKPSRNRMSLESLESARVSGHRDETRRSWYPRREPAEIPGQNCWGRCLSDRYSIPIATFYGGIACITVPLILVIILLSILLAQTPKLTVENHVYTACPETWIGFGSKCYHFSEETRNWTSSQSFCASKEANLVQIETQEEWEFLRRYKGNYDYWIDFMNESLKHNEKQTSQTRCDASLVGKVAVECPFLNSNGESLGRIYIERKLICSKPKKNICSCQTPLNSS